MNIEPQKFFIGVVDLFSTLLPGAAIVYLAYQSESVRSLIPVQIGSGAEGWLVFFFASYLIGHFLFLIGARLDDLIYDRLTSATYIGTINRLAEGGGLPSRALRRAAKRLLGDTSDRALMQAIRIKSLALAPLADTTAVNTFQWCKARLSKDHPAGLAAVERIEADSKFFRSLTVALALLVPILAFRCRLLEALAGLVLLALALWRYANQRRKATLQAYWFAISLKEINGTDGEKTIQRGADDPTHAGGVVYKVRNGVIKYLIVEAEKDRKYLVPEAEKDSAEWVLPKGHIEPGELPRETAVREVEEETGHWARIEAAIGNHRLGEGKNAALVRFYLMKLVSDDIEGNDAKEKKEKTRLRTQDLRRTGWKTRDEAATLLSFDESRKLIRAADEVRLKIASE